MKITWLTTRFRTSRSIDRFRREPWKYKKNATKDERTNQQEYQLLLSKNGNCRFAEGVYISPDATVNTEHIVLGKDTAIAGETQIGIDLEMGERCTVNAGTVVRGKVRTGNDVRIASGAQILGFSHGIDDLTEVIHEQPIVRKGITIGDDVWVGANAIILDGVKIGSHAVVGAGSVVTKNVPDGVIVAGNPARPIRSRKYGKLNNSESLFENWQLFNEKVVKEMPSILHRSLRENSFVDFPNDACKVRALSDAVELAVMTGVHIPGFDKDSIIKRLRSFQDPITGLVPGPYGEDIINFNINAKKLMCHHSAYLVMAVGYALECLGNHLEYPVHVAHDLQTQELLEHLNSLPWDNQAWISGAWVDHFATACLFNARHHKLKRDMSDLLGWLYLNADSKSGMWGKPAQGNDWLQPVNGFYRLTRGTYAQWGWVIPYPKQTIDTILTHSNNQMYFGTFNATACYVLDIIHPLWLCHKETNHRRSEIEAVAQFWLLDTINSWTSCKGLSFETHPNAMPRLQGTEMWLSIAWLCADLLGIPNLPNGYKPLGIHRTEIISL